MDDESLKALDDVNPGDEVEVELIGDAWPRHYRFDGFYRGGHGNYAMLNDTGYPTEQIRTFRIKHRAEVKQDG